MAALISANAIMVCSFGFAPAIFQPTSCIGVMAQGMIGNAMDATPANIPSFAMCNSLMNPSVASATAAAFGVLIPQPCSPIPLGIWLVSKPTVFVKKAPVLTMDAKLMCAYGGIIQFTMTPSMKVML